MTTLKLNSNGNEVKVAQLLLGYIKEDGVYDSAFLSFVKNWQQSQNITQDGVIGPTGWARIAANAPTVSTSKNRKSNAAKALQILLGVDADGIFGNKSAAALKTYQSKNSLTADKICGPNTWNKILGVTEDTSGNNIIIQCEDLKQYASPHGKMTYGPDSSYSTFSSGGCGVTSFSIVYRAYGLAPDGETGTQTIQKLGKYAWQHGYRIKGAGTTCGLFKTNGCKYTATRSTSAIANALRAGKLVILLIKKGFGNGYQGSGHYIVAYGLQGSTILLRDVGSGLASRQKCPLATVTTGLKYAYIMEKSE